MWTIYDARIVKVKDELWTIRICIINNDNINNDNISNDNINNDDINNNMYVDQEQQQQQQKPPLQKEFKTINFVRCDHLFRSLEEIRIMISDNWFITNKHRRTKVQKLNKQQKYSVVEKIFSRLLKSNSIQLQISP